MIDDALPSEEVQDKGEQPVRARGGGWQQGLALNERQRRVCTTLHCVTSFNRVVL